MVGADSPAGALPRAGAPAWLIPWRPGRGLRHSAVPGPRRDTPDGGLVRPRRDRAGSRGLGGGHAQERAAEATRHTRGKAALEQHHARREAALHKRLADQHAAVLWLAEDMLPVALKRLRKNTPASEIVLATDFGDHLDPQFAGALRTALRRLLEAAEMEELTRDSSQRAPGGDRPPGAGDRAPARQGPARHADGARHRCRARGEPAERGPPQRAGRPPRREHRGAGRLPARAPVAEADRALRRHPRRHVPHRGLPACSSSRSSRWACSAAVRSR